jgi:hypothetical protein
VAVLRRSRKKIVIFFQIKIKEATHNSIFILRNQVNIEENSSIKMRHATPMMIMRRSRKKDNTPSDP